MIARIRAGSGLLLGLLVSSCGGSPAPVRAPDDSGDHDARRGNDKPLDVSAEVGALDEEKVTKAFTQSVKHLQACLTQGASRIEFLAGSVAFFVKVDQRGAVAHAHVEQSTLGDRETEKCMLDALRKREWPAAVGGEVGIARKSFDFDPPNAVREPTEWTSDRVTEALGGKSSEIAKCKASAPGSYSATMYVDPNGSALAVGIAPPDEAGESAVDCLVGVVKSAKYPTPGGWAAKVSFTL